MHGKIHGSLLTHGSIMHRIRIGRDKGLASSIRECKYYYLEMLATTDRVSQ